MGSSAGPNIIQDGLILALDASDKLSYPGSGTTWTDISGFNNTPTTVNSPTYVNQSGGGWSVDSIGTNHFSLDSKASIINTSQGTVGGWVNFSSITGANFVFISYGGNGTGGGFLLQSESGTNTKFELVLFGGSITGGRASLGQTLSTPYVGTNMCMIGTYDSSVVKVYINGVEIVSAAKNSADMPAQSYLRINSEFNRTRGVGGYIYTTQIYNRALSASEILQNYNAQKSRFGL